MTKFATPATATIEVHAPPERVFDALTNPALVRQYLYGAEIKSDWKVGSPITFSGEWKGKPYEDKGKILAFEPGKVLKVTHYSPLSGQPDVPENYHTVTYAVSGHGDHSHLTITQENNKDQAEVDESTKTWGTILEGLKKVVEGGGK
jgi:uncharacterized protein YndB with AHSA1/START domain